MDHKVSKDMISSGMIPSGEKTQADLGRTQYGSAPSPSKLMDAYKSMYDKKEEVINEHHKKDADGNTIPHEGEELNEFVVTGTLATLGKLGAMAGKLGAAAAKTGVKVGAKVGGKAGANLMKSVARNPMGAIDNINRVGYAAQTVGNLMPKPRVPAVTKKQSQGGMISADADLFDIVKGQLLDEGYSEKEVNEIMVNLTEEQLEEGWRRSWKELESPLDSEEEVKENISTTQSEQSITSQNMRDGWTRLWNKLEQESSNSSVKQSKGQERRIRKQQEKKHEEELQHAKKENIQHTIKILVVNSLTYKQNLEHKNKISTVERKFLQTKSHRQHTSKTLVAKSPSHNQNRTHISKTPISKISHKQNLKCRNLPQTKSGTHNTQTKS